MYLAKVVQNNGGPYDGCIKVISLQLLGYIPVVPDDFSDLTNEEKLEYARLSSWVYPKYSSPSDFYLPELGESVFVDYLTGTTHLFWDGSSLRNGETWENIFVKDGPEIDSINPEYKVVPDEHKTRVIGTRSGTGIIMYDTWTEERDGETKKGKMVIQAAGKFAKQSEREPIKITLDGEEDKESIEILVQNKDGKLLQSIKVDSTKDAELITLSGKDGERFLTLDSTKDAEIFTLEMKSGHTIVLDEANKKISIDDGDTLSVVMDTDKKTVVTTADKVSLGLDGTKGTFTMKDSKNTIESTDTGIDISNATCKIEMGSASVKINGNLEVLV